MESKELSERIATMAELLAHHGLKKLRVGELEVECWAPKKNIEETHVNLQDALTCACGHNSETEHTTAGCFHGCNIETCNHGLSND